jgi:hypothetical protein
VTDIDVADVLYYSDDPETVHNTVDDKTEGVLFDFDILARQQTRLLFYHVNGNDAERFILVRIFNNTAQTQTLEYITSLPVGSTQYMQVGHTATAAFVRSLINEDWRGVNVAPNENFVVVWTAVKRDELAVGFVEFRQASAPIRCSVLVCDDLSDVPSVARAGRTFKPDGKFRRGKFALTPFRNPLSITYDATHGASSVSIGNRSIPNEQRKPNGAPGQELKGEYGVFTHINASLENTGVTPAVAALYESAHGGPSTATYIIDGHVVASGAMPSPNRPPRFKLATYTLGSNETITTTVTTMPDAGSSSPIELVFDVDDDSPNPGMLGSIVAVDSSFEGSLDKS